MSILIRNANIHTMDDIFDRATAAVIDGDRFAFVGSTTEAEHYVAGHGGAFRTIDMQGALMLPGLNDSHLHFLHFAKNLRSVDLTGTKNVEDICQRLDAWVKKSPDETGWIEGEGWNQDYFEGDRSYPTKNAIDKVTGDRPTIIYRVCHHIAVVNSAGMRALNITKATVPQYGKLVQLDEHGEPDGVIFESLLDNTKAHISTLTAELMRKLILSAQEQALEQGLTSLQSDDICYTPNADYNLLFKVLGDLSREGLLHVRIGEQCLLQSPEALEAFFTQGFNRGWGDDFFKVNCIKMIADGSLGARTAAMRKPYADMQDTKGITLFTDEALNELVLICQKHSCPAAIHAIGDGAIEQALNAIENAQRLCPEVTGLRHGIVHCQITDEALIARFKALNVTAFIQPIFIDYDMNIVADRVGAELTSTSYAWKTMNDIGVHAPFGTDCPVERFDTMPNIYSAVTRKNITGTPKHEFLASQRLTMEQAVRAYTVEGAYAEHQENIKGKISTGMLADFVVLDSDLFNLADEEDILKARVLETWVGGKPVYKR